MSEHDYWVMGWVALAVLVFALVTGALIAKDLVRRK